jgi:hypothetical protein
MARQEPQVLEERKELPAKEALPEILENLVFPVAGGKLEPLDLLDVMAILAPLGLPEQQESLVPWASVDCEENRECREMMVTPGLRDQQVPLEQMATLAQEAPQVYQDQQEPLETL